ncbi:FliH/SctL family protein [Luteimonas lutimaris]|uniref:Flagellar assembly protein FliH n=1 Tax=Luteimonas lutimaris TaxID=698645 RepID=A0ABP7M2H5_9GAMM|nr:FliH/SctL family protein [Luteimonas sp.]
MPAEPVRRSASAATTPATVAVFEPRRFERALAGNVVPARHWQRIDELDALLEQVNALYEEAGREIERAREKGHAEGFAEGLARVQQQMTEHLAALNERRARVLADASSRVTELACAIVARIAPDFDARSVVPPLVLQAVEAAQAEQFLMIRVHPSVREDVAAGLGVVRQAHPAVGVIELVEDVSLDPLSCVVVSEAGEVRAGVAQQIEAIRTALAGVGSHAG